MPSYHLVCTKQNRDGSFDTPAIDEALAAPDEASAVDKAKNFPLHGFVDESHIAWLVDESGKVVWTKDPALRAAA